MLCKFASISLCAEVVKFPREVEQKASHIGSGACQVLVMAPAQPSYYEAGNTFVFLLGKTQSWHQHMQRRLRCGLPTRFNTQNGTADVGMKAPIEGSEQGSSHAQVSVGKNWTRSSWLRASANMTNMWPSNIHCYLMALSLHKMRLIRTCRHTLTYSAKPLGINFLIESVCQAWPLCQPPAVHHTLPRCASKRRRCPPFAVSHTSKPCCYHLGPKWRTPCPHRVWLCKHVCVFASLPSSAPNKFDWRQLHTTPWRTGWKSRVNGRVWGLSLTTHSPCSAST